MEWVSVKDELPKRGFRGDIYIKRVRGGRRVTDVVWLSALGVFRSKVSGIEYDTDTVSHYMQFEPPAPQGE